MAVKERLLMLDIFRGLTVAAMILVNDPGSWEFIYAPLEHSKWHGCTPTDLVFPFFMIIVGVAMAYSFDKFDSQPALRVVGSITRRAFLIFFIGLLLNAFPFYSTDYSALRIMGVLQRIGIAFGIAGLLVWYCGKRSLPYIIAAILFTYWILFLVFGGEQPYIVDGNLVQRVDLWVFGQKHMWNGLGIPFDPEGLLSTMPSIATVLIGYQLGNVIRLAQDKTTAARYLLVYGVGGLAIGLLWGLLFPINKSLWTSSYVVYTAGWAALAMAALLWLVDIKGFKAWAAPAVVFGVNPLFLYIIAWVLSVVFSEMLFVSESMSVQYWLFEQLLRPLLGPTNASLAFAVLFVIMIWGIGWVMHKKRIYIKL